MSRVGQRPIPIPDGVQVAVDGQTIRTEGPKGKLEWTHRPEVAVAVDDGRVVVSRRADDRQSRSLHGLTRSLVANMIQGVREGFERALEVYGVGYSVQVQGGALTVTCGKSHPVVFAIPDGLAVEVTRPAARGDTEPAQFRITGADKQAVGEFAARVRRARPPEPYKGKGIRYVGEYVRRKEGKAFAGTGA